MKDIYKALLAFQCECPVIRKTADNPFFKSKYANLPDILTIINPILQKHGLLILQPIQRTTLITRLVHVESGEVFESEYDITCKDFSNPQAVGSAVSYARRYALSSLLSLNIDDDDDGNAATGNKTPQPNKQEQKPAPKKDVLTMQHPNWGKCVTFVSTGGNISELNKKYTISVDVLKELSKHLHNEQD
jgi:ribosomal protein L31